ncbi:MAG: biotin-dependent carboxyltransferase family protein [Acidobacteriota bacterium]
MSLTIVKEGIFTTLQDLGREGSRSLGVNPGGVMDRTATRIINTLLGNSENEGVLEMHFPAGEIRFDRDSVMALGGADMSPELSGKPVSNWRTVNVAKGDTLRFAAKVKGERTYLAVAGGFQIDAWLGSKSTNLTAAAGGFEGRRLRTGDKIEFNSEPAAKSSLAASASILPRYSRFPTVRFVRGAEFTDLTDASKESFQTDGFVISTNSDRMGFRLTGEALSITNSSEMISSAVNFGTVQLLPDGRLIALMAEHQTTGGYPRIAHVIERDLPLLAQLGPNDGVAFYEVDIEHAELLTLEFDRELAMLKVGVEFAHLWPEPLRR